MKKKIERKIRAAHLWKKIMIAVAVIMVVTILFSGVLESRFEAGTACIGLAVFAEIVCLVTYFGFRRNILISSQALLDQGVTIDEVAKDLENAKTIGKMSKFKCGEKFFSISCPFSIFSYRDILWIYNERTTHTNTSTGATTTSQNVIVCTVQGKKYITNVSWKAAKKFLEENNGKFSPDLIIGYKRKYNKQYKELVKKSK